MSARRRPRPAGRRQEYIPSFQMRKWVKRSFARGEVKELENMGEELGEIQRYFRGGPVLWAGAGRFRGLDFGHGS